MNEDGVLVGAIGVSGSAVENDHAVAEAGVKVLGVSRVARASLADLGERQVAEFYRELMGVVRSIAT